MPSLAAVLWQLLQSPSAAAVTAFCECLAGTAVQRDGTWLVSSPAADPDEDQRLLQQVREVLQVNELERADVLVLPVLQRLPDDLKLLLGAARFTAVREYLTAPAGAQISHAVTGGYSAESRRAPVPPPVKFTLSPLHFAAMAGRPKLTQFLLEQCRANPDSRIEMWHEQQQQQQPSGEGEEKEEKEEKEDGEKPLVVASNVGLWTALHFACGEEDLSRYAPVVAALLRHGADPAARDGFGWTPAAHAILSGSVFSLVLLAAAVAGDDKAAAELILNCDGCGGATQLRRTAARTGSAEVVALCEFYTDRLPKPAPKTSSLDRDQPRSLSDVGLPFFTTAGVEDALDGGNAAVVATTSTNATTTATTTSSSSADEPSPAAEPAASISRRFLHAPWKTFMEEEEPKRLLLFTTAVALGVVLFYCVPAEVLQLDVRTDRSWLEGRTRAVIVALWDFAVVFYLVALFCAAALAVFVPRRRRQAAAMQNGGKGAGLKTFARVLSDARVQEALALREVPFRGGDADYAALRSLAVQEKEKMVARMNPAERLCVRCLAWRPLQRCYHCNRCGVCTEGLDHHCDFFLGCIGVETHRQFVIFTTSGALLNSLVCLMFALLLWTQLRYRTFVTHILFILTVCVAAPTGVWMCTLALGQHINILENLLVFEHIKGGFLPNFWRRVPRLNPQSKSVEQVWQWRNPYDWGLLRNWLAFWTNPTDRLDCNMDAVLDKDRQFVENLVETAQGSITEPRLGVLGYLGRYVVPDYRPAGHIKTE